MNGFVYIVRFDDGAFYIGCSKNVCARFKFHASDVQSMIYKKLDDMGVKNKINYMLDNHIIKYEGDDYKKVERLLINENRMDGLMLNKLLPAIRTESFLIDMDVNDIKELDRQAEKEGRTRSAHIRELIKKGKSNTGRK